MNDLSMLDINPATDFLVSDFQNGGFAVQTLQLDEILQSHFAQHPAETAFSFSVTGDFSQAGIPFGGHPLVHTPALLHRNLRRSSGRFIRSRLAASPRGWQ